MKVSDKDWKVFSISEIFNKIYIAKSQDFGKMKKGKIPFVGRAVINNGFQDMVDSKIEEEGNCISVGMVSTTFKAFYRDVKFACSQNILILRMIKLTRNKALFLNSVFNSTILLIFSYGKPIKLVNFKKQKILLPVNEKSEPDYEYMENYTKSIIDKKLVDYKKYAKKALANLEYKKIEPLENKEWEEFFLTDIFPIIQRGRRLTKLNQKLGDIPYISSTSMNNGVDNFIGNKTNVRIFSDCLTIANSGSVGASFYQPYKFVGSDHITHLKKENMSKYVYLFISTLTNRFSKKYNFNREINDARISREKIMLPINEKNEPDFEYMEQYMKNLTYTKIHQYLNYLQKQNIGN